MKITYITLFLCTIVSGQTYTGVVVDSKTQEPVPNVTIYFSGSSVGTMSTIDGTFELTKPTDLKAALIFRILGYDSLSITEVNSTNLGLIVLNERTDALSTIIISGDPWSRQKKEKLFLEYFLGTTNYSEGISISNLKEIDLRFIPTEAIMVANTNNPVIINHPKLGYEIIYDLLDFQIDFERIERYNEGEVYEPRSCYFEGSGYYNDLNSSENNTAVEKARNDLYKSSLFFFLKSAALNELEVNKFKLRYKNRTVPSTEHIEIYNEGDFVYVGFKNNEYGVQDHKRNRSTLKLLSEELTFDKDLNNLTPKNLMLSGYIAKLGLGGQLPLDYVFNTSVNQSVVDIKGDNNDFKILSQSTKEDSAIEEKLEVDPWSRKTKEKLFLEYFLGTSNYSRGMNIMNLDEIEINYSPLNSTLTASAINPIVINHPKLGYEIIYDLLDFQINFGKEYNDVEGSNYQVVSSYYEGYSTYEDLTIKNDNKISIEKTRKELYHSSLTFLLKSIISKKSVENKFKLRVSNKTIDPNAHIKVHEQGDRTYVVFKNDFYDVQDYKNNNSSIRILGNQLIFDNNLNLLNVNKIVVTGHMGNLGLGGQLPDNYIHE